MGIMPRWGNAKLSWNVMNSLSLRLDLSELPAKKKREGRSGKLVDRQGLAGIRVSLCLFIFHYTEACSLSEMLNLFLPKVGPNSEFFFRF